MIAVHDLYCCLLPQCEALRTCRSGFPIATVRVRAGSHRDLVNWYCSLLTRPQRAEELQGTHSEHKNKPCEMELEIVQNSVVALQDNCCYKAPTRKPPHKEENHRRQCSWQLLVEHFSFGMLGLYVGLYLWLQYTKSSPLRTCFLGHARAEMRPHV